MGHVSAMGYQEVEYGSCISYRYQEVSMGQVSAMGY